MQLTKTSTRAEEYVAKAKSLSEKMCYLEAIEEYRLALKLAETANDWEAYIYIACEIGDQYRKLGNYEAAQDVFEDALKKGADLPIKSLPIAALQDAIGLKHFFTGNYIDALIMFEKAHSTRSELLDENDPLIADSFDHSGMVYSRKSQYKIAYICYEKAMIIRQKTLPENDLKLAESYNNFGIYYIQTADYDQAISCFQNGIEILRQYYDEWHLKLSKVYNNLSECYYHKGDYQKAVNYLRKALEIRSKYLGDRHDSLAIIYNNLGLSLIQTGEVEEALQHFKNAIDTYISCFGEEHFFVGSCYDNMGSCHAYIGDFENTLLCHQKALAIYKKQEGEEHLGIAISYNNIGSAYLNMGDYEQALDNHQKALSIRSEILGDKHPTLASSYQNIGLCYKMQGNFEEALHQTQLAICSTLADFKEEDIYKNPLVNNATQYSSALLLLDALTLKADLFFEKYEAEENKNEQKQTDLDLSFETYLLASQLIDRVRQSYVAENAKLTLAKLTKPIYESAIHIANKLFEKTQNEAFLQHAFTFSEKNQSYVLLSALVEADAQIDSNIPDAFQEEEYDLRTNLNYLDKNIDTEQAKGERANKQFLKQLKDKHFTLNLEYDKLLHQIQQEYPEYYNIKYSVESATVPTLQQALEAETTLVSFFVGEQFVFVFKITATEFVLHQIEKPTYFDALVRRLTATIEEVSRKAFIKAAYQLYQLLLAPVLTENTQKETPQRLIIIPDSHLAYIPFEVLLFKKPSLKTKYDKLPYLLQKYTISYHYSATLWQYLHERPERKAENDSFIGFAPVYEKTDDPSFGLALIQGDRLGSTMRVFGKKYQQLLYSRHEVESITRLFKQANIEAECYLYAEACKQKFQEDAAAHKYIHIAAHSLYDPQHPELSGIIFHPAHEDTDKDQSIFHMAESYHLNLNADLVVLSSCQSGVGNLQKGEGVMTINRGLLYSGAANIIFTLFKIYDRPAFELTQELYRYFLNGYSYAESLRQTKLLLIEKAATSPLSWAGFVLIGR